MAERSQPVLWSPDALDDLHSIWDYYAGVAGRGTADSIVREIGRVAALIGDQPLAGRSRDEIRQGLRSIAASPYVVFYRVANGRAEVVRVLDGRRDVDKVFSEGSSQ